jgi:hypothetical protein
MFQRMVVLLALHYSTGFSNAVVGKPFQMSIASLPSLILHYDWHTVAFKHAKYTGLTNKKLTVDNYLRFRPDSSEHATRNTTLLTPLQP